MNCWKISNSPNLKKYSFSHSTNNKNTVFRRAFLNLALQMLSFEETQGGICTFPSESKKNPYLLKKDGEINLVILCTLSFN